MSTEQLSKDGEVVAMGNAESSQKQAKQTKNSTIDPQNKDLDALLSTMIHLDELEAGRKKKTVVVRLIRMWEAKNFKLNGALMSLDMLLLDENDTLVQASIYYKRMHLYKDLLAEGSIYLLSNFEVVPSYNLYKLTDNPSTICFTDATKVIKLGDGICTIKHEKFRVYGYSEFQRFAGTNIHLLDVVGQILTVQCPNMDDPTNTQKVGMLLLLEDNSTIRVNLWDEQAASFCQQFTKTAQACRVIVLTSLNPKMFPGNLYLNSSGATKVYMNFELQVVKDFMTRMGIEETDSAKPTVEVESSKPVLEILTIEQIQEYISSGVNQMKEVVCLAKVVDVNDCGGWKYLSCGACSKKLDRSGTSLICNRCESTTAVGIAKFRVELIVQSEDRTATFVLFDRDARKITHSTAEELTQLQVQGEGKTSDQIIPKALLDVIGKTMPFQVKISKYNFDTSSQNFTVTRIIPENQYLELSKLSSDKKGKSIKVEDGDVRPNFLKADNPSEVVNKEFQVLEDASNELIDNDEKEAKKKRLA